MKVPVSKIKQIGVFSETRALPHTARLAAEQARLASGTLKEHSIPVPQR